MAKVFQKDLVIASSLPQGLNKVARFSWEQPTPEQPAPPIGLSGIEMENFIQFGSISILPYQLQDDLVNQLEDRSFSTVVLENDLISVTVLPSLGGRVYSIVDLASNREILHKNQVLRGRNLALRGAWFAGGIEWNGGGVPGHAATTCEPIKCGIVETDEGPILRLEAFDRITETCWVIDLFLMDGSPALFARTRIINPNPKSKKVYWWTNIAVPGVSGQRIVSPSDYSIEHILPDNHLEQTNFPDRMGFDASFPENWTQATAVFFRRTNQEHPWIASVNPNGSGFGQVSTSKLVGRKFFYFGEGDGGKRWLEFLGESDKVNEYVEIQSGLTTHQNQLKTIESKQEIAWTEAFFPLDECAHAIDVSYESSTVLTQGLIEQVVSVEDIEKIDTLLERHANSPIAVKISEPRDWGALHSVLLSFAETENRNGQSGPFVDAWDYIARQLIIPDDILLRTDGFVSSDTWLNGLRKYEANIGLNWFTRLHIGICELDRGNPISARRDLLEAFELLGNWQTAYYLGVACSQDADNATARTYFGITIEFDDAPLDVKLAIADTLFDQQIWDDLDNLLGSIPREIDNERFDVIRAQRALHKRDFETVARILQRDFASIREGDVILETLWSKMTIGRATQIRGRDLTPDEAMSEKRAHPLPKRLQFSLLD
ncbi:MAG: DUF5107 domain-containing protein [Paracoccaceae bacterium]